MGSPPAPTSGRRVGGGDGLIYLILRFYTLLIRCTSCATRSHPMSYPPLQSQALVTPKERKLTLNVSTPIAKKLYAHVPHLRTFIVLTLRYPLSPSKERESAMPSLKITTERTGKDTPYSLGASLNCLSRFLEGIPGVASLHTLSLKIMRLSYNSLVYCIGNAASSSAIAAAGAAGQPPL